MGMEIRPLAGAERKYAYMQSMQLEGQTGSIGHLRGDFGKDGNGFLTSWEGHREQWATDAFRAELDTVINALRSEEYGLLQSPPAMGRYAAQHPESLFRGDCGTECGFRVETEKYAYLIRCNPAKENGSVEIHCYVKEWLDRHIQKAGRGIRFIDSGYSEKFRIPDGGKIAITTAWGERSEHTCRYIDETHLELDSGRGGDIFHICQFAEIMERNGSGYAPAGHPRYLSSGEKLHSPCPGGMAAYGQADEPDKGQDRKETGRQKAASGGAR